MTDAIATLLASDPGDPATLPDGALLDWLQGHFCTALRDEAFRLRLQMRAIWQAHPELLEARDRLDEAAAVRRESPEHDSLVETGRALRDASRAVAGLTEAVDEGRADEAKLAEVRRRLKDLRTELGRQQAASPPHRDWAAARQRFDDLLVDTGLFDLREELEDVERARGRGSGVAGRRFEDLGAATLERELLPALAARGHDPRLLRGVTLGCARGEWDALIVEASATSPAIVLGMAEFKRNPNDIARGFALRQENLAWLRGDSRHYDPSQYRTHRYPTGHFEGPVTEAGLTFTKRSFAGLTPRPATGDVLASLHFVTTDRPLTGLNSRARAQLLSRLAGDRHVDWTSPSALANAVRGWIEPGALRTADVLQRYVDGGYRNNVRFALHPSG